MSAKGKADMRTAKERRKASMAPTFRPARYRMMIVAGPQDALGAIRGKCELAVCQPNFGLAMTEIYCAVSSLAFEVAGRLGWSNREGACHVVEAPVVWTKAVEILQFHYEADLAIIAT